MATTGCNYAANSFDFEQDEASAHDAKKKLHIANGNLNKYAALCSTTKSSHDTSMLLANPNAPKVSENADSTQTVPRPRRLPSCTVQKRGIEKINTPQKHDRLGIAIVGPRVEL